MTCGRAASINVSCVAVGWPTLTRRNVVVGLSNTQRVTSTFSLQSTAGSRNVFSSGREHAVEPALQPGAAGFKGSLVQGGSSFRAETACFKDVVQHRVVSEKCWFLSSRYRFYSSQTVCRVPSVVRRWKNASRSAHTKWSLLGWPCPERRDIRGPDRLISDETEGFCFWFFFEREHVYPIAEFRFINENMLAQLIIFDFLEVELWTGSQGRRRTQLFFGGAGFPVSFLTGK